MLPNVDQEYSNWVEHAKVLLLLFADTIKNTYGLACLQN